MGPEHPAFSWRLKKKMRSGIRNRKRRSWFVEKGNRPLCWIIIYFFLYWCFFFLHLCSRVFATFCSYLACQYPAPAWSRGHRHRSCFIPLHLIISWDYGLLWVSKAHGRHKVFCGLTNHISVVRSLVGWQSTCPSLCVAGILKKENDFQTQIKGQIILLL